MIPSLLIALAAAVSAQELPVPKAQAEVLAEGFKALQAQRAPAPVDPAPVETPFKRLSADPEGAFQREREENGARESLTMGRGTLIKAKP